MSYHRLTQSGCPPELLGFGTPSMALSISSDDDMIAVPRSVLAAAAHCARRYAGTDSETYKRLSEYSISFETAGVSKDKNEGVSAFRQCAKINREMATAIGAVQGSSIWSALEACAERMEEIAAEERSYGSIPISDHSRSSGLSGWHPGDDA